MSPDTPRSFPLVTTSRRWRARLGRGLLVLATGAALATGLAACGHTGPGPGAWATMSPEDTSRMRQRLMDRATRELALDASQQQRLGVLLDKVAEQRLALRGTDADPRARLNQLMAGSSFDRSGAQALVDQKTAVMKTAAPALISAFGDFFDSLKPEQQQKVRQWLAHRGGHRWMPGHGMGGGMGGGMGDGMGHGMHGPHGGPGMMPPPDGPQPPASGPRP